MKGLKLKIIAVFGAIFVASAITSCASLGNADSEKINPPSIASAESEEISGSESNSQTESPFESVPESEDSLEQPAAFSKGLSYTVSSDGKTCTVTGIGSCTDTELVIPSRTPEGHLVTSIGNYAFFECIWLASVTIPDSVTSIGEAAFRYCSGLETVYYTGTPEQWDSISIIWGNDELTSASRYFYSESEPNLNTDSTAYDGNYWHYDENGNAVIWDFKA